MKKILIAEDSKYASDPVVAEFEKHGYQVLLAKDGHEGYQLALKHHDIKLIISDINMPLMDGLSMISKIRNIPQHANTAIIMLTAETDEELKSAGRKLNVSGWIRKPFKGFNESLKQLIEGVDA